MKQKTVSATAAQAGANLAIVQSTVRVVMRCLFAVFFLEVAVSVARVALGIPPSLWFAVVRGVLMAVLLLPIFYRLVLRPVAGVAAQHATASSEARFEAVAQATHDGIVIFDEQGIILFANKAVERIHGFRSNSLRGQSFEILMPADVQQVFRDDLKAFQRSGDRQVFGRGLTEQAGVRVNGERFPVEISVSALAENGKLQFVVVMRDISARKHTERQIQERTMRLNALIASSPLAIVVLDKDHHIQMCNIAFEQLFQYRSAEIAGLDLDPLVAPKELMGEAMGFTELGMKGQGSHAMTQRRRKDGTNVDVEVHGVPLVVDGRVEGAYAIYQDISERRKLKLYEQILPVCCMCGKIRDAQGGQSGAGSWDRLDRYIARHSDAKLSHTFCPPCLEEYRKREGLPPSEEKSAQGAG